MARSRLALGAPLLRLRSDEQLVALFRSGHDEAFRVIYDRYRQRLFAYTRQMLPGSRQDAEDALQDVFVRAYSALRANDRELALRAWLYRIAHNRCIDELRRPAPPAPEVMELVRPPLIDPIQEAERRESLRRLIADVRRLPEQQRSALLMRELGGMSYVEVSVALGVSIPAVKSLLVRARVGLGQALEARETSCASIREELIGAHDRGVRPTGMARRHMRDCLGCRSFRGELRGTSREFAALLPAIGPLGMLAKLLGVGSGASGGAAASGTAAGGGAAAAGGIVGTGGIASLGALATGAGHAATLLAAAVVTAGGAVEIQHSIAPAQHHRPRAPAPVVRGLPTVKPAINRSVVPSPPPAIQVSTSDPVAASPAAPVLRHRTLGAGSPLPPKPVVPFSNSGDPSSTAATGADTTAGSSSDSSSASTPGSVTQAVANLPGTTPQSTPTTSTSGSSSGSGSSTPGATTVTSGSSTPSSQPSTAAKPGGSTPGSTGSGSTGSSTPSLSSDAGSGGATSTTATQTSSTSDGGTH